MYKCFFYVSVKNKDNKLTTNQWSCGEYNNNTDGFTTGPGAKLTVSNQYSSIGEQSLMVTETGTGYYSRIVPPNNISGDVTFTFDVLTPARLTVRLISNNSIVSEVIVSGSDCIQNISLSGTVSTGFYLQMIGTGSSTYFLDNIRLY